MVNTGRPTLYKPEYVEQVERLCRIGVLDEDIADFFSVHVDTIHEWKNVHSEFSEAIKRGKAVADQQVAEKLIDRAMRQTLIEEKEVKLKAVEYENGKKVSEEKRGEIVQLRRLECDRLTMCMITAMHYGACRSVEAADRGKMT